jgi:hypothetical protein
MEDPCEKKNEASRSIWYREFYEQLSDYRLIFKKRSAECYYSVIYTVTEYDHLLGNGSLNTD